jgi:hypothetical protein
MYLLCSPIDGSLVGCFIHSAGGKWSQRERGTQGRNLGYAATELWELKSTFLQHQYQG